MVTVQAVRFFIYNHNSLTFITTSFHHKERAISLKEKTCLNVYEKGDLCFQTFCKKSCPWRLNIPWILKHVSSHPVLRTGQAVSQNEFLRCFLSFLSFSYRQELHEQTSGPEKFRCTVFVLFIPFFPPLVKERSWQNLPSFARAEKLTTKKSSSCHFFVVRRAG